MTKPRAYKDKDNRTPLTVEETKVINRAKRMVMKKRCWSEPMAFHTMRKYAMNSRIKLHELAQQLLDGRVSFEFVDPILLKEKKQ